MYSDTETRMSMDEKFKSDQAAEDALLRAVEAHEEARLMNDVQTHLSKAEVITALHRSQGRVRRLREQLDLTAVVRYNGGGITFELTVRSDADADAAILAAVETVEKLTATHREAVKHEAKHEAKVNALAVRTRSLCDLHRDGALTAENWALVNDGEFRAEGKPAVCMTRADALAEGDAILIDGKPAVIARVAPAAGTGGKHVVLTVRGGDGSEVQLDPVACHSMFEKLGQ